MDSQLRVNSTWPLYGRLGLTEDGSIVLSLVFDESKGTRTGYDLLYADRDFNGTFEEREKLTVVTANRHGTWLASSSFARINLNVPYSEKGVGISSPCQVVLAYRQYPRHGVAEDFSVGMDTKLRQETTMWDYSFSGSVKPCKRLEDAKVWTISETPKLEMTVRPAVEQENVGIGLRLLAAENELECRTAGQPVKAHVEIKKLDGEVVRKGDATLDKLTFG